MPALALVPGIEVRSSGATHLLGAADFYLFRSETREPPPPPGATQEIARFSVSPPRLRAGVGWRTRIDADVVGLRAWVGQQGLVEGFQPLVGGGVLIERGRSSVGLDGSLNRGVVRARTQNPEVPELVDETPLRNIWLPRWEVSARLATEPMPAGTGAALLAGAGAGAAGGLGVGLGAVALSSCKGEGCTGPFIMGLIVGETLAIPLGVHLSEGRRGSYGLAALASTAVAIAGLGALAVVGDSGPTAQGIALIVPLVQLGVSLVIERGTGKHE